MDLKSIMNDHGAASQRVQQPPPRISTSTGTHTPQSSYDGRIGLTPSSDVSSAHPTPHSQSHSYGPPLPHNSQPGDLRAQGQGRGDSFNATQSPYPNTASISSAGPYPAYAQGQGSHGGLPLYQSREPSHTSLTHNAALASQSPGIHHQPSTPGSAHQNHSYPPQNQYSYPPPSHINPTAQHQQFQSSTPPQPNGLPPQYPHRISPANSYHGQPATPLGPPIYYPRQSPQTQRPLSQGGGGLYQDHVRKSSVASIGSTASRDYNPYPGPPLPEALRRDSVHHRSYSEYRGREDSLSVSPKTIPRPPPHREQSSSSQTPSYHRSSLPPQSRPSSMSHQNSLDRTVVERSPVPQLLPSTSLSDARPSSNDYAMHTSPAATMRNHTPVKQELVKQEDNYTHTPVRLLKRSASHLSDTPARSQPVKRPRHEIPTWAESARKGRRLNLDYVPRPNEHQRHNQPKPPQMARNDQAAQPPPRQNPPQPRTNGNGGIPPQIANGDEKKFMFDQTINNIIPSEPITRAICDWIFFEIGSAPPPTGSVFEVEAKLGHIIDKRTSERLQLPVESEVLLGDLDVRFESHMTLEQHKSYNEFLNRCCEESRAAYEQKLARAPVHYSHPKENDEFYILTPEGRAALHPDLQDLLRNHEQREARRNPKEVKVRRTIDKNDGNLLASIIKTRMADRQIYCPREKFDYRISISLETPWEGAIEHLKPIQDSKGRNKDRLSYEHKAFHIDLTQVSNFDDPTQKDHELEVEINPTVLACELDKIRKQDPTTNYEPMIQDLLSNVRLLIRHGTRQGRA